MQENNTPPEKDDGQPERDRVGRWRKGESGNPKGRPAGSGRLAALRATIAADVPAIIASLTEKARDGDVQAARLLLERVLPPVRSLEPAAELPDLPEGASPGDFARRVLAAAAAGEVSPSQAAALMTAAAAAVRVIEGDELEARIRALEAGAVPGGAKT